MDAHLNEAFLDAIDTFFSTGARNTDTIWPNANDIAILPVQIQVYVMRFPAPNDEESIQVTAARIPWAGNVSQTPIIAEEMDDKQKRKSVWKPREDVEHDEAEDYDMRTRAMQLTKEEVELEAAEDILKSQGRKVHSCRRDSGHLRLVEKVSNGYWDAEPRGEG
jgi:hypothetical protein